MTAPRPAPQTTCGTLAPIALLVGFIGIMVAAAWVLR